MHKLTVHKTTTKNGKRQTTTHVVNVVDYNDSIINANAIGTGDVSSAGSGSIEVQNGVVDQFGNQLVDMFGNPIYIPQP